MEYILLGALSLILVTVIIVASGGLIYYMWQINKELDKQFKSLRVRNRR